MKIIKVRFTISTLIVFFTMLIVFSGCANLGLDSGKDNSLIRGPNETVYALPSQQAKVLYVTNEKKEFKIVEIREHWTAILDEKGTIGWIYEKDQTPPPHNQIKTEESMPSN